MGNAKLKQVPVFGCCGTRDSAAARQSTFSEKELMDFRFQEHPQQIQKRIEMESQKRHFLFFDSTKTLAAELEHTQISEIEKVFSRETQIKILKILTQINGYGHVPEYSKRHYDHTLVRRYLRVNDFDCEKTMQCIVCDLEFRARHIKEMYGNLRLKIIQSQSILMMGEELGTRNLAIGINTMHVSTFLSGKEIKQFIIYFLDELFYEIANQNKPQAPNKLIVCVDCSKMPIHLELLNFLYTLSTMHYPGVIKKVIVFNMEQGKGQLESIIEQIKKMKKFVEIIEDDYKTELFKHLRKSKLPIIYGGKCEKITYVVTSKEMFEDLHLRI